MVGLIASRRQTVRQLAFITHRSVRMSLLYSIVRVISPSTRLRTFARAISVPFIIVWVAILVLKVWWCAKTQQLAIGRSACHISSPIAIFQVTGECNKALFIFIFILFLFFHSSQTLTFWQPILLVMQLSSSFLSDFFGGSSFHDDSGG